MILTAKSMGLVGLGQVPLALVEPVSNMIFNSTNLPTDPYAVPCTGGDQCCPERYTCCGDHAGGCKNLDLTMNHLLYYLQRTSSRLSQWEKLHDFRECRLLWLTESSQTKVGVRLVFDTLKCTESTCQGGEKSVCKGVCVGVN